MVSLTQGVFRWPRPLKQRAQYAVSPPSPRTHHRHIILLAVCRVSAGDALCRDGTTRLGRHGIHGSPGGKHAGAVRKRKVQGQPVTLCSICVNQAGIIRCLLELFLQRVHT